MFMESGSLGEAISAGTRRTVLVFSGQDPDWATGVQRMLLVRPELRSWAEEALQLVDARLKADPQLHPELASCGVRAQDWLGGGSAWTAGQLAERHLCLMGSLLAHMIATASLAEDGLGADAAGVRAVTGHSAGLLAAWLAAAHGSRPSPEELARGLLAFAVIAAETERQPATVGAETLGRLLRGEEAYSPMLAVAGPSEPRVLELLDRYASDTVAVSLQNSWDRFVLGGPPQELQAFRDAVADEDGVLTDPLPSSCGYHHRMMGPYVERAIERMYETDLALTADLRLPLIDARDASEHIGGDLTERVVASMAVHPVRWADTLFQHVGADDVLLDVGPSIQTAAVSRRTLRGGGATAVAAGDPAARQSLFSAEQPPEPLADWSRFRPRIATSGPHRLHTRHTDRSGRSAIVLSGMTPSTVDAAIVSAAANAGHVAEIAGGGQVSASVFSERMIELSDRLSPGQEVVFNALHLDPYLWNLHLGRDRLVQRARAGGAPILGVTVSAGVPETDEAVELLDELDETGIWLNAFKPGDVAGVRKVLAIADRTDHDVWIHLEGGLAGGHHSWANLEEVLFTTYSDIRARSNVILVVGGGVGSPQRAAELIGGTWALRHGPRPMPVDGVLLGTVAMATAESTASDSVKRALAAAPGASGPVRAGKSVGGVTSGRSGLGADIHYLDNHAAKVAEMLDEVAGDPDAVSQRREEIEEALSRTAKPYFGDLTQMTWLEVVERYAELCALGRHGRYEDGRWLDITHRSRFLDLLRRAEARCSELEKGTFASVFRDAGDLDDPAKATEQLVSRYPRVASAILTPPDVATVIQVCDSPGKPVPFVVAIDAEVRRRYLSDSLWQSHSDLWEAEQVLVIPGPTAVAGIDRVDEPVADLLDRFDSEVAEILAGSGHVDTAVPSGPETSGAVEAALSLITVRQGNATVRSPIAVLGDREDWVLGSEDGRCIAELRRGPETAILQGPDSLEGRVELTLRWPSMADAPGDGHFTMALDIHVDHGVTVGVVDEVSLAQQQADVLDMLVAAASGASAGRSSGPAPLVGRTLVPDAVMARVWAPVFSRLAGAGAADGLLRLVHTRHRLSVDDEVAETFDPGDPVAELGAEDHLAAGRLIRTSVRDGSVVARDEFLVRAGPGSESAPDRADGVETQGSDDDVEDDGWVQTPRHFLARRNVAAPRNPEAFAAVSGDANPIHRSELVARLAGLPGRIVHGMWTSAAAQAFVIEELLGNDSARLVGWDIQFTDVLEPGAVVELTANRVAARDGHRRIEVRVESAGSVVALATADVAPLSTAYVFPGQGIQAKGMGLDALERSPAARGIWERADRHCRAELGFSVLEVVRDNPEVLTVGDETHRHPAGVLHLTQFTQVAMATLAAAQVEELRDAGMLDPDAVIAGHSVGEYNALASAGGVLPLEAVLSVVWARGTAMHQLVPRAVDGSSDYRLGVVRPHLAGRSAEQAGELVDAVSADTGQLCQIVNYNLRGRQYAVAGTVAALAELESRLGPGSAPGRAPFLLVPGIDVPFHSRALADGVPEFRAHLDEALPAEIDPGELLGRYVPNLHPEPFSLERSYVESVALACDGKACHEILADWDAMSASPARLARELLIELLAWQFASPVRWIETTDVLLGSPGVGALGVEKVIEIGLGAAPTLTNLTRAAVAADRHRGKVVLHFEADRAEVFELTEDPEPVSVPAQEPEAPQEDSAGDDDLDQDWDGDAPGPASARTSSGDAPAPAAAPASTAAAAPAPSTAAPPVADRTSATPDRPVEVADALGALLAHLTHVRPEQLGDDSIDDLVDGASSRRNQVLMDLGKEFGVGSVDGAQSAARSVLSEQLAPMVRGHRHPGAVLSAAVSSGLTTALGPLGSAPSFVAQHVESSWGLGPGWAQQCELELFLGARDGASRRGGDLRTLPSASDASELVDAALLAAGERLGVHLERPVTNTAGATADAAELAELAARVGTAFEHAAEAAATVLAAAGAPVVLETLEDTGATDRERLRLLDLEHGSDRAEAVAPSFDKGRIRCLDSSLAWARADLDHLYHGGVAASLDPDLLEERVTRLRCFIGTDDRFDATVEWYRQLAQRSDRTDVVAMLDSVAEGPNPEQRRARNRLGDRTVLISGASPGSIGEATAAHLLAAGATVVMVSHSAGRARRLAVRELMRRHGGPGARLFLVRANLASFTDIDRLVDWLDQPAGEDHPGIPDVVLPFAAAPVAGDVPDTGPRSEVELRVLLLGVERLVGRIAEASGSAIGSRRLTAVLPMSPNHGTFGGDGSYGDAKAGLEVLESRRRSEFERWGRHCRIIGAEIGWVRGTGLMSGNDALAPVVEQQLGVRTFSAHEMGALIVELCAPQDVGGPASSVDERSQSTAGPTRVDLTGGLAESAASGSLSRLLRSGLGDAADARAAGSEADEDRDEGAEHMVAALPSSPASLESSSAAWPGAPRVGVDDLIVICGTGEVGPWGAAGTRARVERDGDPGAAGIVELALFCGLVEWEARGLAGGYVDVDSGDPVEEADLVERYREEVLSRCGIRAVRESTYEQDAEVFLDRPVTIGVADRSVAEAFVAANPGARASAEGDSWTVALPVGAPLRLRTNAELPRGVTAAIPDGMTPVAFGVPVEVAGSIDPLAAWNLAVTAEAFRDAGTDPAEILANVHPARVGNTQGTGMGGLTSLRGLNVDPVRGVEHSNDLLQEALANVPAAHTMQSFIGGYGPMVQPVGACATAAVSLEVAADMVRLDKADVVVAGGMDDLSREGIIGFADMAATADSAEMARAGFEPSEMSRPGDRDRAGFVESQGGGAMLVCRGSVAQSLGLPVRAVVGLARSHSDGVQTSIPAPGLGLLAVSLGGAESALATALADLGLTPDDIAVVSKHDTSTRANDPNEAAIHEQMCELLGRTPGNPLRVVSQKSLTGHAKGGAAAWQIAGVCDMFESGVVPGNPNLDSVDPQVQSGPWLVPDDRALRMSAQPRAALLTSLGFGHVAGAVLLVHPDAFEAALHEDQRADYLAAVQRRREVTDHKRRWALHGGEPSYSRPRDRRLAGDDDAGRQRSEMAMLADPGSRLGASGVFESTAALEATP